MPELPEIEVICEVLQRRLVGETITDVELIPPAGPIVVRDLTRHGFAQSLAGTTVNAVNRRGKFLVFSLHSVQQPLSLVFNFKLTGRLQLTSPDDKRKGKTHLIFTFASGGQLRYLDQKQMGQVYLTYDLEAVPGYAEQGPEPLDISLEVFHDRSSESLPRRN